MAIHGAVLCVHAIAVAILAIACPSIAQGMGWPAIYAVGAFAVLGAIWLAFSVEIVAAHGFRVLVRTFGSDAASLQEGSVVLSLPEYIVHDRSQFGPWSGRKKLPIVGQVLEIDVPEVVVPVESGLYCLKVNTKVVGSVQRYTVEDLMKNTVPIEHRIHDVIAQALRSAVYDKSIESALTEIQRIFLKDAESLASMITVPSFQITQLALDADKHISPATEATRKAMDIAVQKQQEDAQKRALAASIELEEEKMKLRKVVLQSKQNELMLQQEAYGKEGAAMIEAAKHAKALYLFQGGAASSAGPLNPATVLTLPS